MQWLSLLSSITTPELDSFESPFRLGLGHETCPVNSPASCSLKSEDSCCYEATNGLFLQTQFWDYDPATGDNDTWTIHGLWSDKCLGGFNQFCNPSWAIKDAVQILENAKETDLLESMRKNWRNMNGDDPSLWLHEFNKHGTCMATVNPDCYHTETPKYQYVVDFYKSVVSLWETLPSYDFLTRAGIHPDEDATHTLEEWNQVLGRHVNGKKVYLGCDRNNAITEIWYFFTLQGAVANGKFSPTDTISTSTCRDGFKWLPKRIGTHPRPPPHRGPGGKRTHLEIEGHDGCIISDGSWYKSGTCASFQIEKTIGGVELKSSKGPCGVDGGRLVCGKSVSSSDFTAEGGYLAYGGETFWSAAREPSKFGRSPVSIGSDGDVKFKIKIDDAQTAAVQHE